MKGIKERFDDARKIYGATDEIITASGTKVRGRYVLCESGVVTPSHDPFRSFAKSEGFPTDENGQTVNDRDYERDMDAQKITQQIADGYDSRALQTPVVVSDGIVLSGNGRTMAGMIAAKNNSDGAYVKYVYEFSQKWGFTHTDVMSFEHPRIIFETTETYQLTTKLFAMFNAQDTKSQSKTEQAVKFGKVVSDVTYKHILHEINSFDTIGDFYNNAKATTDAVNYLLADDVINEKQYPEMFDGETISQSAREILENVLIGKAFESNPDAIRQIKAFKGMRRNIINALAEISNNVSLEDYSLDVELSQAIALCYQARANGCFRHGDMVSGFARQMTIFGESSTIADFRNSTVMLLADMVNHTQVTKLKKVFVLYNAQAKESASGQTDVFSTGEVKSKEEILDEVCRRFDYSTAADVNEAVNEATKSRVEEAKFNQWSREDKLNDGLFESDSVTKSGAKVGSFAGLVLPSGDTMIVKLEMLSNGIAGIRTKGWVRFKVSEELIVPTECTKPTLPNWFSVGTTLSNGLTIESIGRGTVTLSDRHEYAFFDILLNCTPQIRVAA